MRKVLLFLALAAIAMVAPAQNLKVNVPMPGGLASLVGDRLDVEKLTVTGIINDSDFRFIRSLTKLKEVNLRKLKNTQIGDSAFYGMKTLESVRLPRRLVLLGVSAFEGCENLTSIEFPGHLQTLPDYMLKGCCSIDKVYIHNTHVMHIGKGAFMDSGIRLIGLSPDLRTIGPMAFANCKRLQVISIPQWVTEIGSLAFANCVMLRSIIVATENPPVCALDAFNGLEACTLSVKHPEFYRDRVPWSKINLDYDQYNGEELHTPRR
ncbi:MAG: leucine-rich repeat domain-containing protein [Prevotella sp.]|nr:leucine-rich repeat domain-containing protein [Prevotella sp.]